MCRIYAYKKWNFTKIKFVLFSTGWIDKHHEAINH